MRHARVTGHGSSLLYGTAAISGFNLDVYTFNAAGSAADGKVTVQVW
jgi:hypothetical protein